MDEYSILSKGCKRIADCPVREVMKPQIEELKHELAYYKQVQPKYADALDEITINKMRSPITRDKIIEAVGKWNNDCKPWDSIEKYHLEFLLKELGL